MCAVDYSVYSATKILNLQRIKRKTAFVVMTIIKFQCNESRKKGKIYQIKYEKLEHSRTERTQSIEHSTEEIKHHHLPIGWYFV